ncbi:MAG: cysteine desulfurase / selenocysteine lyase [Acidimicrobiaceae bacterium]|jgi:cysteine desulfurase/selenocysteine lyase|nr:cysteine desulfurase / selenocysteine lyase [Acidimicrobiaceae bacterium]MDQ1370084.1 cysteine desulfurase / selenocysteine lyase [Acidimicrobiaceae bacterium]MDQ1377412.1 cysteine desulfurase / selenocysteine lyase [Acidimicrobiaceae bacterium]MDQ1419812.1 cysteine desulfurase / selenocysteine lyase [Acidimicrobiaceae bacterium]MDQ1442809.1 cysteine desulfurase / selenocysteine lyase [Acidimicrobiaceae bacterium]
MALDVELVKKDFAILDQLVHGHRIVYLDSASSSQKPAAVLDAMQHLYETTYANVHRGVYAIAEESTRLYEEARTKVAAFLGAASTREVIFTKNVTEAINLVAYTWGRTNLGPGDAVLLTEMEHHANLVPWLQLKAERGIELRYLGVDGEGQLILDDLEQLVDGVKLVGLTLVSNVLGTLNPVAEVARVAHAAGALVLVDGAQYTPHFTTRVAELGCDFYGFTAHKMLGPTGIGCLWARESLLEEMPIFLGGGEMIRDVRLDGFTANELPWKFEAGTPPIAEAVGLGAAVDYLLAIGMADVRAHEIELTRYALESLHERHGDDIRIFGPSDPEKRGGVLSFAYKDIHPHDISQVLDEVGVCVRAGHHCAKPLMRRLGVGATARASFYLYNDEADVDALSSALTSADRLFS